MPAIIKDLSILLKMDALGANQKQSETTTRFTCTLVEWPLYRLSARPLKDKEMMILASDFAHFNISPPSDGDVFIVTVHETNRDDNWFGPGRPIIVSRLVSIAQEVA